MAREISPKAGRIFQAYIIRNICTDKQYVGVTCVGTTQRWRCHKSRAKLGSTLPLHKAIRKHGAASFTIQVVASAIDWPSLLATETALIVQERSHCSTGMGYNSTWGGEGGDFSSGLTRTEEHKKAISKAQSNKVVSAETRQKLREAAMRTPQTPPVLTPEVIEKIRITATGKRASEETRARMSLAKKGVPKSAEHRAKISSARFAYLARIREAA